MNDRKQITDSNIVRFFANYTPAVQDICSKLRILALELLPESEEILFEGWKNVSYGTGESHADKDLIIYIAPFKNSVNLGFYRGANLKDPNALLKGTGKLLRHVKIKSDDDIKINDVRDLIVEARNERLG